MRTAARRTTMAEESPEFKAFWDCWRQFMNINDGRGSARDEFFRQVEIYGANPQDLVDGARWFIRGGGNQKVDWQGSPIRKHASSWLATRAYEDGCEQERAYQARLAEKRATPSPKPLPEPVQAEPRVSPERVKALMEQFGFAKPEEMH